MQLFALSLLLASPAIANHVSSNGILEFAEIQGRLCINPSFTELLESSTGARMSVLDCARKCSVKPNCQAFAMPAQSITQCTLFVFDRCSKAVTQCGCNQTGQVFVRKQPGLPTGLLCPQDYVRSECGASYRVYPGTNTWETNWQKCQSEPGLTIMADIENSEEMKNASLLAKQSGIVYVFVSGVQEPNSSEPTGGWFWRSCNFIVDPSLWSDGEPNNGVGSSVVNENYTFVGTDHPGIGDIPNGVTADSSNSFGVLCECVSPF